MTRRDRLAFAGSWERRGMVSIPVIDDGPGTPQPAPQRRPACAQQPAVAGRRATYRTTTCDVCGCLILVGETCPGCLAWAERDAVQGSWRAYERENRRTS